MEKIKVKDFINYNKIKIKEKKDNCCNYYILQTKNNIHIQYENIVKKFFNSTIR